MRILSEKGELTYTAAQSINNCIKKEALISKVMQETARVQLFLSRNDGASGTGNQSRGPSLHQLVRNWTVRREEMSKKTTQECSNVSF